MLGITWVSSSCPHKNSAPLLTSCIRQEVRRRIAQRLGKEDLQDPDRLAEEAVMSGRHQQLIRSSISSIVASSSRWEMSLPSHGRITEDCFSLIEDAPIDIEASKRYGRQEQKSSFS